MTAVPDPAATIPAIVLCDGKFAHADGKTAHGLVRHSELYDIQAVIDATLAGRDAGEVLDGRPCGIPIVADLESALAAARRAPKILILGVATDGGRIPPDYFPVLERAIRAKLDVMSGLHEELNDQPRLVALAKERGVTLTDVRRAPAKRDLHFFTGKIEEVTCPVIAVLGTDSAIGKRTTARLLVKRLNERGAKAVFVGTGQTGRMQGGRYGIILDSIINDFVTGEIEHAVHEAWKHEKPDIIVVEGQGALTHPAYPGGFEIIAGARVRGIVLQHAPGRKTLDGFPQYPMPDLGREIQLLELLSLSPVIAITLNHENLDKAGVEAWKARLAKEHGKPVTDPLWDGADALVEAVAQTYGIDVKR
ncbi:MAG TPA: DUF1611 domain-containing protein [Candidatus Thermoplasmatota archaeon]|nr:DUF1611 domain-containing protein [Candidatus Thermoplasmatota archaeon]